MLKHYSPASVGTRGPISTCNHRHRGIVQQNYTIRCLRSCSSIHTNTCTHWFILFFIYSEPLIQTQDEAFCITIKNEKHNSILFYRVVFVFQSKNTKYLISFTRTGFSSITFIISVSSADNPVKIISIWPSQKRFLLSFSHGKLLSTYIFTGYISNFDIWIWSWLFINQVLLVLYC